MSAFSPRAAREFLHEHLADYLDDLRALVNVDCGTHNRAGVNHVGEWVADRCDEWDWKVKRYRLDGVGDCWHATLRGSGSGRLILLGHLDTVYPDGTAAERPLRIEDNTIYGPGVADMKAGLLTGMWAMRALQMQDFDDFDELMLFCNCDEEVGSAVGAQVFTPLLGDMDAALVLEAARANGDIVSARKGGGGYMLRVHGRAAHAGVEPEKGANAIVELSHQIIAATALNGIESGVTVNVDIIRGGSKLNVVADFAEAMADVRATNPSGIRAVDAALRRLPEHISVPGTRVEIAGGIHAIPMPKTPGNALLVELAQRAAEEQGFAVKDAPITGGTSDANFAAAAGLPVIDGLGPIGGNDHSPAEFLELDSILPRTAMLTGLLAHACTHYAELRALRQ